MLMTCESSGSPDTEEEKGKQTAKGRESEEEEKWMERAEWQKSKLGL